MIKKCYYCGNEASIELEGAPGKTGYNTRIYNNRPVCQNCAQKINNFREQAITGIITLEQLNNRIKEIKKV